MYKPVNVVEVMIWGSRVGAVTLDPNSGYYVFEYEPKWIALGIELSPFNLPINKSQSSLNKSFIFPNLPVETYKRLPAMLADALPDKFGNALIDAALADEGVPKDSITALDRLAYMNNRGMGAIEFRPPRGPKSKSTTAIDMALLVEGARNVLEGKFGGDKETEVAIRNIIQVGISAGGARAKAVVAWNPETMQIRSGQIKVEDGFEHWLLKLDGVGKDLALGSGAHYGRIEYAYYLMARAAGINMMDSRLLEENERAHFMTKRYDRDGNTKHHVQTLCSMKHLDFNMIGAHSYAQYFEAIYSLNLGNDAMKEGFRRMVFNVIAANCDDHTKNFSFLLKQGGSWELTPAYDITHAHNPENQWTKQHLMSVNGKFSEISRSDFMVIADLFLIQDANAIIDDVMNAIERWSNFADQANLPLEEQKRVQADFRFVSKKSNKLN
jgi:serine/threonine-protein kinase HipA